jgi:hypothetical protein
VKTQIIFLLLLLAFNLTCTLCFGLETTDGEPLIPGMKYTQPINGTGSFDDYAERFNVTELQEEWNPKPFDGIFILGDLFSGESQYWKIFGFMIDGVPTMLTWTGSFIPTSQVVFSAVANVVRIISVAMFVLLLIELISGRELLP